MAKKVSNRRIKQQKRISETNILQQLEQSSQTNENSSKDTEWMELLWKMALGMIFFYGIPSLIGRFSGDLIRGEFGFVSRIMDKTVLDQWWIYYLVWYVELLGLQGSLLLVLLDDNLVEIVDAQIGWIVKIWKTCFPTARNRCEAFLLLLWRFFVFPPMVILCGLFLGPIIGCIYLVPFIVKVFVFNIQTLMVLFPVFVLHLNYWIQFAMIDIRSIETTLTGYGLIGIVFLLFGFVCFPFSS